MAKLINVETVAFLTGEDRRRVWEKINDGDYRSEKQTGVRGGSAGESYLIPLTELPIEAQIRYMESNGVVNGPANNMCDLGGYRARYGNDGMDELLQRQSAAKIGLTVRNLNAANMTQQLADLAADYAITLRTLYRWMNAYEADGLAGLMRKMERKDKGESRTMCPAARQFATGLYLDKVKRTHATIYNKLCQQASKLGSDACKKCIFNDGTAARKQLALEGVIDKYPPCKDPYKIGMRVPESRQTLSRQLGTISPDEITLSRRGKKAWKDDHMLMATREKPLLANEVWFGDHHQFDTFVLDEHRKAVRPWLTAWYDAATGCMPGWLLCTNPNTETITEAFARSVAYKKNNPFHGLPRNLYIDNGKDYRSKTFETGMIKEHSIGYLNTNIATCSVVQLFNIGVTHAKPYNAWSKNVERFFSTLEDIWIREVPGWCGGSPNERPEDHARDLKKLVEHGKLWTMDEFFTYLSDTVFPEYHNRPHEGYNNHTPMEMYTSLDRARNEQPDWDMLSIARENMATRKITQQGIRFKNNLYWDDAMIGMAGTDVSIRFGKSDLVSITVLHDNHFLCEAEVRESFKLIGEDPEKIEAHISKQNRQLKDTQERIKRATRSAFAEDVDLSRSSNLTGIEYKKAASARRAKREEIKAPKKDNGKNIVGARFEARYEELLKRAQQ